MRARINTTYEVDGKSAVSAQEIVNGAGEYTKDFEVSGGETVTFPLSIDIALTESIVIVPSVDMTFTIGPRIFTRNAGEPLIWTERGNLPCPLTADSTDIEIHSHAETNQPGLLLVRIIERNQPPTK